MVEPVFLCLVVAVVAALLASTVTALVQRSRRAALESQIATLTTELSLRTREIADGEAKFAAVELKREELLNELSSARQEASASKATLAEATANHKEQLAILQNAREELSNQFKALANEILEEKSKRFAEQNQVNLGQLLNPLREKIQEFQGKVEQVYLQESKDRSALSEQVKQLIGLNQQLSEDATNLTRALRGSSKTQGDWGELILEHILEASGLRKDETYFVQKSFVHEDGRTYRPDVVLRLPDQKHLIIDAKVSLTAYNDYVNCDNEELKADALDRHIRSVRSHVKELSAKSYQTLPQLHCTDFVVMFVPLEPAFLLAISQETSLWQEAYKNNILLVSPSTLLFVLRIVAHLWNQEYQRQNVAEIAKKGADLYEKFVGFVEDFRKVGNSLDQARSCYEGAMNKLSTGKGNAIRQAEMLKELGVKTKKSLPQDLLDSSAENTPLLAEVDGVNA